MALSKLCSKAILETLDKDSLNILMREIDGAAVYKKMSNMYQLHCTHIHHEPWTNYVVENDILGFYNSREEALTVMNQHINMLEKEWMSKPHKDKRFKSVDKYAYWQEPYIALMAGTGYNPAEREEVYNYTIQAPVLYKPIQHP